eukprot:g10960.t1
MVALEQIAAQVVTLRRELSESRRREEALNTRLQAAQSTGATQAALQEMVNTQKAILEASKKPDKKLTLVDNRSLAKPRNFDGWDEGDSGWYEDELRADRGEEAPREEPRQEEAPPPPEEPRRKKSRWGEEDPLAAAGIPEWLRDQFAVPKLPPEPTVRAGQRKVKVPQHCVGRILGKMGATINEIQEASNTDIKMNQDTKEAGYSYAVAVVEWLSRCQLLLAMRRRR